MRPIRFFIITTILLSLARYTDAQQVHAIDDNVPHYIFRHGEIESLEDKTRTLTFEEILSQETDAQVTAMATN